MDPARLAPRLCLVLALLVAGCGGGSERCPGEGCCETSLDCDGWESCGADGRCASARTCTEASDCLGDDVCSPNGWCGPEPRFDPTDVVLWGEIGYFGSAEAAARFTAPTHLVTALWAADGAVVHDLALDGQGNVIYLGSFVLTPPEVPATTVYRRVKRLVPDPWLFENGSWRMPEDIEANDTVVPTPACDPLDMVPRPGSTGVVYSCPDGKIYDGAGSVVAEGGTPLAITAGGMLLLSTPGGLVTSLGGVVVQREIPYDREVLFARAHGEGFWVVAWNGITGAAERWVITGAETRSEGRYPARTCNLNCEERGLDAAGAVYRHFWALDVGNDIVSGLERCALGASSCTVAYAPLAPVLAVDSAGSPPQRLLYPRPPGPTVLMGP